MRFLGLSLCAVLAFELLSCNGEGESINPTKVDYHSDGSMKLALWEYDSLRIRVEYDNHGRVIDSIPFIGDEIQGIRMVVNSDSDYVTYVAYERGQRMGLTQSFYSNGSPRSRGSCRNNQQVGNWYFFTDDSVLTDYKAYDVHGELAYFRSYGNHANVVQRGGHGIVDVIFSSDSVRYGDEIFCLINVAVPPYSRPTVVAGGYSESQSVPTTMDTFPVSASGEVSFRVKPSHAGYYRFAVEWSLTDSADGTIETDTIQWRLRVFDPIL